MNDLSSAISDKISEYVSEYVQSYGEAFMNFFKTEDLSISQSLFFNQETYDHNKDVIDGRKTSKMEVSLSEVSCSENNFSMKININNVSDTDLSSSLLNYYQFVVDSAKHKAERYLNHR